ncbi:hypothetical protein [Aureivirga sp. CE67]|uniref:hypothetical protein n=1 Tax=Aureivirga sp. CE67 TaxID=1788983 RepID=UPI0018CADFBC|nr:hypothetical protein [Aureivirga sp. CE67]
MKKDEFYIGYINQIPSKIKRKLKFTVWILVLVVIVFAVVFSFFQNKFKNSTFELTNVSEITGTFHSKPYPSVRIELSPNDYKNVLLLGFGKFGPDKDIENMESRLNSIEGKEVSIKGNLIYYNGKTLLQIADSEKFPVMKKESQLPERKINSLGEIEIEGEVIDPKCYFGVMKPGFGKIHRSCAVRCISGGIPPVFTTRSKEGNSEYFMITDSKGNKINHDILEYVGQPVKVKGALEQLDNWFILKLNVEDIELLKGNSKIYSN